MGSSPISGANFYRWYCRKSIMHLVRLVICIIYPVIAQLVERRTVVVSLKWSLGRRFNSVSRDGICFKGLKDSHVPHQYINPEQVLAVCDWLLSHGKLLKGIAPPKEQKLYALELNLVLYSFQCNQMQRYRSKASLISVSWSLWAYGNNSKLFVPALHMTNQF